YDPEEDEKRAQQVKQEQLANAELLHTAPSETEGLIPKILVFPLP
ncbi:11660_t:CDS:1, partial [Racocetra fulgida]